LNFAVLPIFFAVFNYFLQPPNFVCSSTKESCSIKRIVRRIIKTFTTILVQFHSPAQATFGAASAV